MAVCNGKNPRYAIFLPLHLNTVTVVIESLKFTNHAQRRTFLDPIGFNVIEK